jgi:hypothetical protein
MVVLSVQPESCSRDKPSAQSVVRLYAWPVLLNKYIRSELSLLYDGDWYQLLKSSGYLLGKHCT